MGRYQTRSQVKAEQWRKFKRLRKVESLLQEDDWKGEKRVAQLELEKKELEARLESLAESLAS